MDDIDSNDPYVSSDAINVSLCIRLSQWISSRYYQKPIFNHNIDANTSNSSDSPSSNLFQKQDWIRLEKPHRLFEQLELALLHLTDNLLQVCVGPCIESKRTRYFLANATKALSVHQSTQANIYITLIG